MKKLFTLILSLLLITVLAACGSSNSSNKSTSSHSLYDQVKKQGVLTIGTEGTYAPFSFHDKSGNLTGFDVDIAKEVAKRIGVKPKFVETKWDGMIAGLDAKRFDMVANEVSITPERQKKYTFSSPYIQSKAVLIVNKNNNTIKGFKDLKGKKDAQSLNSNYNAMAKSYGAKITPVDGFTQSIDLLTSGRVDATINDNLSYLDLKNKRPELPTKVVAHEKNATKNAFMLRQGSDKLVKKINQALTDMKKDGTYLKISKKYFGTDVSK